MTKKQLDKKSPKLIIGKVENIDFPMWNMKDIPARIDSGAKTSSIWASNVSINADGLLSFTLFDSVSEYYSGQIIMATSYTKTVVASSTGQIQERYKVKMTVKLKSRKINASFTLADRSNQVYPILVGRNILHGKFLVDVTKGKPLKEKELQRTDDLRSKLDRNEGHS